MFTGLVEEKGTLAARRSRGPGAVLSVRAAMGPLSIGESIAVEGVCLTVARTTADGFEADVSSETLDRTTLGGLSPGAPVNLERSLALGDRLGGHLVSGHVDGTCTLTTRVPVGDALTMTFRAEARLGRFIAEKGSVAVNGVSLTVNAVGVETFEVAIIPHTRDVTSLGSLAASSKANLEVDLLARYVARLFDARSAPSSGVDASQSDTAWLERLKRTGIA
jgi:riboflavin synthase